VIEHSAQRGDVALAELGTETSLVRRVKLPRERQGRATARREAQAFGPPVFRIWTPLDVFSLANPGEVAFEAIAVAPVGVRARLPGGEPFAPPWTE
jgi:hypothetical protein